MKAAIFDCFAHHYDIRTKYVKEVFEECGYDVDVFSSDYDHMKKSYITDVSDVINYIHVPAYKKNLSFARLYSHYVFSVSAKKILQKGNYDIAYSVIPPNSIVNETAKYRLANKNFRLIIDVFDMWPESFPSSKAKKLLAVPFDIWRRFRDNRLENADTVISECNLFKEKLEKINPNISCKTLYLCKEHNECMVCEKEDKEYMDFVYLGSVNNIIDINFIVKFMSEMKKYRKCRVHIIGNGEKYAEFIQKLSDAEIENKSYGAVYENETKKKIFAQCDFAFNIMKKDVFVGLTMKSIDYFSYGVPIINNIMGDTFDLVRKYNVGFNTDYESIAESAENLARLSNEDINLMKKNIFDMYNDLFSEEVFKEKLKSYIIQ